MCPMSFNQAFDLSCPFLRNHEWKLVLAFHALEPENWNWTVHSTSRAESTVTDLTFNSFGKSLNGFRDVWMQSITNRGVSLLGKHQLQPDVRLSWTLITMIWNWTVCIHERQDWEMKRLNQRKEMSAHAQRCFCTVFSSLPAFKVSTHTHTLSLFCWLEWICCGNWSYFLCLVHLSSHTPDLYLL